MKLMNVRGTFDYMPKDMMIRNKITDTLRKNFEKYGYLPIETPILNYYDLLSYKYDDGAEILNEIYKLTDQGDRNLGLRYDLTVPFCKVVGLNKDLQMPFRRYEIGRVFRNGPVKLGRTREFYQCDVDVVGIDIYIKYNNRKLMSGLILEAGIEEDKVPLVIGVIDKKEKVTPEDLVLMLEDLAITKDKIDKLLNLFDKEFSDYEKMTDANALIIEGVNEIKELNNYLSELGILDDCKFVSTLARGLSIYTGLVFEFYDKKQRLSCAIGAGGRYNKIITNFMDNGQEYPAVGLSFGLEPIYVILKEEMKDEPISDVYMVPLDTNVDVLRLATSIRSVGFRVLIEMNKRKVGKCFEYAERNNIPYVMIVGNDEVSTGKYKIKDMNKKEEYTLTSDELVEFLKKNK